MLARRIVDLDFDAISIWFENRLLPIPDRSLFPPTGFIVDGIAAGFLYFTDSRIGIIDCYISNPHTEAKTRSDALDMITDALIAKAKAHGCRLVKCDSKIEATKKRAISSGFKPIGSYEAFVMTI